MPAEGFASTVHYDGWGNAVPFKALAGICGVPCGRERRVRATNTAGSSRMARRIPGLSRLAGRMYP